MTPPDRAPTTLAVLRRVAEDTPRALQEILPQIPDWLVVIINKLLAKCHVELQSKGAVTCVAGTYLALHDEPQSSHHAPRDEPSAAATRSKNRRQPGQTLSKSAAVQPSAAPKGSSRGAMTATLKRALFFIGSILAIAAIIAVDFKNRTPDMANGERQPAGTRSEISNSESEISNPETSWRGWPVDAPPPAIAPFNAEQAKQHQETWAKYLKIDVEYTNSIGMKFPLIPPGEFTMGSTADEIEEALKFVVEDKHWQECIKSQAPQHKVILTQPIYLGVNEVTQAEYEKVMGLNPSHFAPMGTGKEAVAGMETTSHPVETVSWNEAAEFSAKLSKQEELKPFYFRAGETITPLDGTGYRLPPEAEWEYACRAGTTTKYWIGDKDEDLVRAGWFGTNSGGRTHAAGELKANPYGLCDIRGNVWEWVEDWWEPTYYGEFQEKPAINPGGPSSAGSLRVIRGGDWLSSASTCRAANRRAGSPPSRNHYIGFRVSLVAGVSHVGRP